MIEQAVIFGIEMMADFGIGAMAGTIARACTPENANKVVKACIMVGGIAAGGAVAMQANDYIEDYARDLKLAVNYIKEKKATKKAVKKETPVEAVIIEQEEVAETNE